MLCDLLTMTARVISLKIFDLVYFVVKDLLFFFKSHCNILLTFFEKKILFILKKKQRSVCKDYRAVNQY